MSCTDKLLEKIYANNKVIIYGAGAVATTVIQLLTSELYNVKIVACAVSDFNVNKTDICSIPVYQIDELIKYKDNCLVIIATMDKYYMDIVKRLHSLGFDNILSCTFESRYWSDLRTAFLQVDFEKNNLSYCRFEDELQCIRRQKKTVRKMSMRVFMVRCHVDKMLQNIPSTLPAYMLPIQVGKHFTDQSIAILHDDIGDNISQKNKQYCELTALYWVWKNIDSEYKGICHYRRWFDIPDDVANFPSTKVEVILITPIISFPSVEAVYFRDHDKRDWQIMLDVLQEFEPEYYQTAQRTFKGIFYYPYNMLIAKKNIFDTYCNWLFPLLAEIESRCQSKKMYIREGILVFWQSGFYHYILSIIIRTIIFFMWQKKFFM